MHNSTVISKLYRLKATIWNLTGVLLWQLLLCLFYSANFTYWRWVYAKQGRLFCLSAKSARRLMTPASYNRTTGCQLRNTKQNTHVFPVFLEYKLQKRFFYLIWVSLSFIIVQLNGIMLLIYNKIFCLQKMIVLMSFCVQNYVCNSEY